MEDVPVFHIGVWCAYGQTLLPHDGIGIFTYELMEALLANHPDVAVSVAVRAGDAALLTGFAARHPGRFRIIGYEHPDATRAKATAEHNRSWRVRGARATAGPARWFDLLRNWGRSLLRRPRTPGAVIAAIACSPVLIATKLIGLASWRLRERQRVWAAWAEAPVILPFDSLTAADFELAVMQPRAAARAAGCAVWLYPYLGVLQEIRSHPSVLFIHDVVFSRFPEYFARADVDALEFVLRHRCDEATLFGCLSEFIRANDLIGRLGLPPDRIRMIRPAVPSDCRPGADPPPSDTRRVLPPYFFYPAGIRGYKNHTVLVAALTELEARGIVADLAFTTETEASAPADLKERIAAADLRGRVHFLGTVSRAELKGLYRHAVATIVPSLYEQGSFPIYESVLLGCPVACSDIPPLREQCEGFGEDMLHFDPRDPSALADAMQILWTRGPDYAARQSAAAERCWTRTWKEVATEWLAVFREAAARYSARGDPK